MTKNALFAAAFLTASGLGVGQSLAAPANECVSTQPNHVYRLSLQPLDKVLNSTKQSYIAGGKATTVYATGQSADSQASADKCEGASPTYMIYTSKKEFDRVRGANKGKIAVSTDPTFESSGSTERACLDVPVIRNRVQRVGEDEVKITFTLDEDAQMKAERQGYTGQLHADGNKDVLCYRFNPGKINMTIPAPKTVAPEKVSPKAGEAAQEKPTFFKFLAPLFGQ